MTIDQLNPGIIKTVERLQSWGFQTTDSGDGVTRQFECDPGIPYVHMIADPKDLVSETCRLVSLLEHEGIVLEMQNEEGTAPTVEASYLPVPGIATISLWNVVLT